MTTPTRVTERVEREHDWTERGSPPTSTDSVADGRHGRVFALRCLFVQRREGGDEERREWFLQNFRCLVF
ncbi:unnamed protein product [Linum trigynum]|uniref:Uncharacterized protein n=1 Tax=Linum trigynum TaxID=586398 RepID=A0AAV2FCA6_9ROSI